jgi:hypothetical protein
VPEAIADELFVVDWLLPKIAQIWSDVAAKERERA